MCQDVGTDLGLTESRWVKIWWWWCGWSLRIKRRPPRTATKTCSRDDRSRKSVTSFLVLRKLCSLACQDPYILRNHLGSLECRLCLTLHTNEGSYLAHTQGKKHQTNLARRAARDAKDTQLMIAPAQSNIQRKVFLKIGRPGYRVTKVRDRDTGKEGMMVQVHLPQIKPGVLPRRRFMSAWEQKREPPNKAYQYLIVRLPLFNARVSL